MKFFADSKPKKTEEEKFREWLKRAKYDGEYLLIIDIGQWHEKNEKFLDKLLSMGYKLLTVQKEWAESPYAYLRKPKKVKLE